MNDVGVANITSKKLFTMKNYTSAPLPFQGQKRTFLKHFKNALNQFPKNAVYVDLFGGSGLLSRTVKDFYPNSRVVYNDYDNYSRRLNVVKQTNDLLQVLRELLIKVPEKSRVPLFDKDRIMHKVKSHADKYGYVDFVTLSSCLLFSGKYVTDLKQLEKETFYNRIRKSNIEYSEDYLDGLEVVQLDYKQLYSQFKDESNVVFLIDPPYLSTDTKSYNSDGYWRLKDYLDVLDVLTCDRYFYFTSNKSSLVELCEWFGAKFNANPFKGSTIETVTNRVNKSSKYVDYMLYK